MLCDPIEHERAGVVDCDGIGFVPPSNREPLFNTSDAKCSRKIS